MSENISKATEGPIPAHVRLWPHNSNDTVITVPRAWTEEEAIANALAKHPDCSYAEWDNGLDMLWNSTIVVKLWRDQECYMAGDPPRRVCQGYYR